MGRLSGASQQSGRYPKAHLSQGSEDNQAAPREGLQPPGSCEASSPWGSCIAARSFTLLATRIPAKEMRNCWSTAIYDTFADAQLAESRRRVEVGIVRLEDALARRPYLAGSTYSLADICAFATVYALPLSYPKLSSEELSPHMWNWLKKIHARPAIEKTFSLSRRFYDRVAEMRQKLGLAKGAAC